MGLYASYETITDEQISDFQQNPSSEFWEDFSPKIRFDLDKFWDVLHFVLTGSYTFYFESDNSELKWLHKAIIGDKTLNEHDFKDFDPKNMGDEIIEFVRPGLYETNHYIYRLILLYMKNSMQLHEDTLVFFGHISGYLS